MNKKLLKSILCIASGVAIATSIPFTTTSCGSSSSEEEINPLPDEVYKFSEDGKTLLGFQDAFLNDSASPIYKDNFKNCDTMEIPANVKEVIHTGLNTAIPSYIKNLTFAKNSQLSSINSCAFQNCSSLTSVDLSNCNSLKIILDSNFRDCESLSSVILPSNLTTIKVNAFRETALTSITFPSTLQTIENASFDDCSNLSSITWNKWGNVNFTIGNNPFRNISSKGTITVIDPIDQNHNSEALLAYLKTNAGLPSGEGTDWKSV